MGYSKDRRSDSAEIQKITDKLHAAYPIKDKSGKEIEISFESVWVRDKDRPAHLLLFEQHLRKVVPSVVRGMYSHPLKLKRA